MAELPRVAAMIETHLRRRFTCPHTVSLFYEPLAGRFVGWHGGPEDGFFATTEVLDDMGPEAFTMLCFEQHARLCR